MESVQKNSYPLLGAEFNQRKAIDFDDLPEIEKSTRIRNYIIKHYEDKIDEKLLTDIAQNYDGEKYKEYKKKCELEYETINGLNARNKGEYLLDENLLQKDYIIKNRINIGLTKDAAALCQLTYACDPNRAGDNLYHTYSKNWIPYIPQRSTDILSLKMQDFFDKFKNDNRLNTPKRSYTLKEKWEYGTFRSIFTGDIDLLEEFDKRISRRRTGFFSMLYYRDNGNGLELAYVTSGTTFNCRDQKWDVILDNGLVNLGQGLSGLSPQHTLSIQNAKILDKFCSIANYKLYFFGHSLGGGLAIANSLATGRETIVFNNAGLNVFRNWIHRSHIKEHNITAYFTDRDFLSTEKENKFNPILKKIWQVATPQNIGKRIYLGKGGHGIDGICQTFSLEYIANKNQIESGI